MRNVRKNVSGDRYLQEKQKDSLAKGRENEFCDLVSAFLNRQQWGEAKASL